MTTNPTAPQDGGEKLATEWAGKLPRDQFEMLLLLTNKAYARGRHEALEEAAKACEQQRDDFLSPEYATGQPLSSFQERFACGQCIAIIRALQQKGPSNG